MKSGKKLKDATDASTGVKIERNAFTIQFVWQETPLEKRLPADPDAPKVDPATSSGAATPAKSSRLPHRHNRTAT
ncbi:MAG: hypothetical protein NT069_09260 [Planctomycetota bacterium]|nr:hypothetical protein [Planctomycetota bacterium]